MTSANTPASACDGKHAFDSHAQALKTIGKGPIHLAPYRCMACSKWHIGSHHRSKLRVPISKRKTGRAPRRLDFEADVA